MVNVLELLVIQQLTEIPTWDNDNLGGRPSKNWRKRKEFRQAKKYAVSA